ncbi:magnetosome protein MamQ [Magnetospirillum gryphiswaldense]|uniref:LemA family protein n=3 Tax=Magnetospirillum gryphiswaldense TaxID=55518 RepID=V6F533_MAGGM|nr:magnetosome protein MamQ [Magnetospirillum gryphiswaldense]CAM76503.1 lemA protein [Magnetospirillum gryphiswaldense MSR-1]CDL00564.1 conserved protein of unknown function [Magnetospirillum gryphiswaldense MSR-1 v2]
MNDQTYHIVIDHDLILVIGYRIFPSGEPFTPTKIATTSVLPVQGHELGIIICLTQRGFMTLQFRYFIRAVSAITVLVVFAFGLLRYNEFLTMREDAQSKRSNFEVEIQRRNNLFGNLINLTVNHASLESTVFNHGSDKRTEGVSGSTAKNEVLKIDQIFSRDGFGAAFGKIIAYSERYPDIKSVKSYKLMMSSLVEMEERIANNRVLYNESAAKFNAEIRKMPWKYLAIIAGFQPREYFHQGQESTAIINAPIVAPEMYQQLMPLDSAQEPNKK